MAPPARPINVHFEKTGGSMTYVAEDKSATAHLMQAIGDHIGFTAPEQKTLRYKFLGVPPLTPEQFVENDIRGLIRLSPLFPVEVIQLGVSRIEHLPTASHKTKTRDADDYDGGKQGGGRVKSGRSWRDVVKGRGKALRMIGGEVGEVGEAGEGAPPIKAVPVGEGGGGGVPIKAEPVGEGGGGRKFIKAEDEDDRGRGRG
ncbi:hypothetical protein HK104_006439 [Borealophlyctis nickersoniae]|nr:hypothetical protein HK104_006439 [Borealophlyctis nickersoniae]